MRWTARIPELGATLFPPGSRKRFAEGTSEFLGIQGIHFGHDAVVDSVLRPTAGAIWVRGFHFHEPIRGGMKILFRVIPNIAIGSMAYSIRAAFVAAIRAEA